jgi:regulator of protease activity HflC (stomatin/prohibitin superfamily)
VSSYYGKQLSEVMDTQIRPYAQQLFTEESAKYTMDEFLANKSKITKAVRDGVTKKFAEQGIVIMTLGMQGDIQWDPKIQESIDTRIRANNEYLANQARNKQKVEAATAASREAKLLSGETAMKIRQLEIEKIKAETQREAAAKWDGKLPVQMVPGGATPFVNVGK